MFDFFRKHHIVTVIVLLGSVELLSFFSFFLPEWEPIFFTAITVAVLAASLYRIEYGLLALLVELVIGSKGYLFFLDVDGTLVSIRLSLFLVVMSVWFVQTILRVFSKRSDRIIPRIPFAGWYFFLFAMIGWGIVRGMALHGDFGNLFLDMNGYLYFALLFPLAEFFQTQDAWKRFAKAVAGSLTWVTIKTAVVFFVFTHGWWMYTLSAYKWIRDTGVGEITRMDGNFHRVFFQGHIWELFALMMCVGVAGYLFSQKFKEGSAHMMTAEKYVWVFASAMMFVVVLSFSRSFWVGAAVGVIAAFLLMRIQFQASFRALGALGGFIGGAFIVSVIAIFLLMNVPPVSGDVSSFASLLSDRATASEAAGQSRQELFKPLWEATQLHPVLGSGFGSTVTYFSKDPRILANNPTGEYTTFAFEWGYLDLWYKMGIGGIVAFGGLLTAVCVALWRRISRGGLMFFEQVDRRAVASGVFVGLVALAAVHFFTPYLNHPLGIGFLLLASVFATYEQKNTYR